MLQTLYEQQEALIGHAICAYLSLMEGAYKAQGDIFIEILETKEMR